MIRHVCAVAALSIAAASAQNPGSLPRQGVNGPVPMGNGVMRYDRATPPGGYSSNWWKQLYDLFQWKPASGAPFRRSVAFLAGVSKYENPQLRELRWVGSDLDGLRNYLLTGGGFDTVLEVREGAVTRAVIEEYLSTRFTSASDLLGPEDRLLFFYSGHGADNRGLVGYLQFSKAVPGTFHGDSVLPVRDFQEFARVNVAKHFLVILDACASGLAVQGKGAPNPRALLDSLSGEGSGFLLTAGTGDQKAYQIDVNSRQGYSVLTRALMDALQGTGAGPEGLMTIEGVFAQAQMSVKRFESQQGRKMDPQLWDIARADGMRKGSFVFLNPNAKNPKLPGPQVEAAVAKSAGPPRFQTNPADGQEYVWIEPGKFTMGCTWQPDCYSNETAHPVTLTKGYWLGRNEVTQAAWKKLMPGKPWKPAGDDLPVFGVTWEDASAFCAKAGGRLPTEAEWEYAAKSGVAAKTYGPVGEIAWYKANSGGVVHAVRGKGPSEWGLHDMLGNVTEWVADRYGDYPARELTDPAGPVRGGSRVVRGGGSYNGDEGGVSSAFRLGFFEHNQFPEVGLRCALDEGIRAGAVRTNPRDGLEYVWIPPGKFTMGCDDCRGGDAKDEKPRHEVEISQGFWIGETEVTQAAYDRVAGRAPSTFAGLRRPVENVTWEEAAAYCKAVGLRLPTEAEWEYAAGARIVDLDEVAWHRDNSNSTRDVRTKAANEWGLYDMLGNVREWVADWYSATYYSPLVARDPAGPDSSDKRAVRGGSWRSPPEAVRISFRNGAAPSERNQTTGFRCAGKLP